VRQDVGVRAGRALLRQLGGLLRQLPVDAGLCWNRRPEYNALNVIRGYNRLINSGMLAKDTLLKKSTCQLWPLRYLIAHPKNVINQA
jgi:hypothetical protein